MNPVSLPTLMLCATGLIVSTATPVMAGKVGLGWDLWETAPGTVYPAPGTYFVGVPFKGVPLVSYDFGTNGYGEFIGVRLVGPNTDTIVRRLAEAVVDDPVPPSRTADPIPIEMVAWQLASVVPFDAGGGFDIHYLTLQSIRGGPASTGEMTITFDRDPFPDEAGAYGTFTSFIDVAWDLRVGCLTCPVIMSDTWRLVSSDTPWGRLPPRNALAIPGVNVFLNGNNRHWDFWPLPDGIFIEEHPSGLGSQHATRPATIPEPATWALLIGGFGLVGLAARRRREAVSA